MGNKQYEHKIYSHQEEKTKADAMAWAFISKDEMVEYPFTFPAIGDSEIRANVSYCGLCLSDIALARGKLGDVNYPIVPGHEVIGLVSHIGKDVKDFNVGDKVGFSQLIGFCGKCKFCKSGEENLCSEIIQETKQYSEFFGGYATAIQQPAKYAIKLPENLNEKLAAPLLCAGISVYEPILKYATKDCKTCVFGIGGLGHMAIKFLKSMGVTVLAATSGKGKYKKIKELGADEVVDISDQDDLKGHKNTIGLVINTSPDPDALEAIVDLCYQQATIVQIGLTGVNEEIKINGQKFKRKELKCEGSFIGSKKRISEMLHYCADNNIYPEVEGFEFENFPKALNKLENGKPQFRCVVSMQSWSKVNGFFK